MNDLDLKILKTLITDNIKSVEFAQTYNSKLFHEESRLFANFAIGYIKNYRTPPTLRVLKEYAGQSYAERLEYIWTKIDQYQYDTKEYPFDLGCLKKRYTQETLEDIKKMMDRSYDDPDSAVNDVALRLQEIRSINSGRSFTQKTVKEYAPEFLEQYEARESNPEEHRRILTHYSAIDYALGGFRPAELFLIGGATNSGKSMLLMNMAIQMWIQNNTIETAKENFTNGHNVLFFSLEMPYEDLFFRFLARLADVPERSILDATLTYEEKERINTAKEFIANYPFELDIVDIPRGLTVQEAELRFQDACLKYKPDAVIFDYLGLMHSPEFMGQPDWLKIGGLAGELHEFGRVHDVVVGSAVQLTDIQRGTKTDPKEKSKGIKVGGHRIGRSSLILHHANFYMQIEERANEELQPKLLCHVVKNRRGPKPANIYLTKNFTKASLIDMKYIPPHENKRYEDYKNELEQKNGTELDLTEKHLDSDISSRINEARNRIQEIGKTIRVPAVNE